MDDFFPPGYTDSMRDRGHTTKLKRRETNTNNLLQRIISTAKVGVGQISTKALNILNDDDEDGPYLDDNLSDSKYEDHLHSQNGNRNRKYHSKYDSVIHHTKTFRHSGYRIERRLSSHECLQSRYRTKCNRRRNRPRSKSDPDLLPQTRRFHRKLEYEYRPKTANIYTMRMSVQRKEETKQIETRSHADSRVFRYIFEDSDFEDDSYDVEC